MEGDAMFSDVELVKFMDEALKKPNYSYIIKIKLERWTDQACKHWESVIHSEPHWKHLKFKYFKKSRTFRFEKC